MGLIDDLRKKRDSWTGRLEEHRRDKKRLTESSEDERELEEADILRNRKMVGVFPRVEQE